MKTILFISLWSVYIPISIAENVGIEPEQIYTLAPIIEATNIDNQDYSWKITIKADSESQRLITTLHNPNPHFKLLNTRALELANNIHYDDLPKTTGISSVHHRDIKTVHFAGYALTIKFPYGVTIRTRPDLSNATHYIAHMCNTYLTHSDFRAGLISQNKTYVSGWVKLSVDENGIIRKIDFINQTSDKKFNKLIENSFNSMRFYPFNQNGKLIAYTAGQAFKITCEDK